MSADGGPRLGSTSTAKRWAARAAAARADRPGGGRRADALRVRVDRGGERTLRTASGRRVVLRGANVIGLVDYGGVHSVVGITPADGAQAAALGLTVVRLGVSWSKVQPAPGITDQAYLAEVRRAARVFADRGIYVLLDMHHDRYAANLGQPLDTEADGAPRWAVDTGSASCDSRLGSALGFGGYYGTACAATAASALWKNKVVAGKPLQTHYGDAVLAVAAVGRELGPAYAGIELYNEPRSPEPGLPEGWAARELWPMYGTLIGRLRAAGATAPVWFDSAGTGVARFSGDPNLVYAPHVYDDVYDRAPDAGTGARLRAAYDGVVSRARGFGAAAVVGEYAGARGGPWESYRQAGLGEQDRTLSGGIVWVWKQHPTKDYGWGVLQPDGALQPDGNLAMDLGRPRLVAAAPAVASQRYDGTTLTVVTRGAGVVELWNGVAKGGAAGRGRAPVLTVDGAAPRAAARVRSAGARVTVPGAVLGGRRIRLTVPKGTHTLRLRP
ncbi:unannotated protein [freshwater metagenome]|uniref:Unannotated protein n=1 Tax=freshwater metagenome TaxID=449393 RepID=A0A6J7HHY1_9ZZZZ